MRVVVIDIRGVRWTSDPMSIEDFPVQTVEAVNDVLDRLLEMFRDIGRLNYISMSVLDDEVFFNPKHVIAVSLIDRWTDEEIQDALDSLDNTL